MVIAAVLAVLNLKRVAGLGVPTLPALFIIIGGALMVASRMRSKKAGDR